MSADRRAHARAHFAAAAERFMLKKHKLDVVVLDLGDEWHVLRTDGAELSALEAHGFRMYLKGYRLFVRAHV